MTKTVREIALSQPSSMRVFEKFGIDYCCGGHKPLTSACAEQNVSMDAVLAALAAAAESSNESAPEWGNATLASLIDHITSTHHAYVVRELPRLDTLAQKVVAKHGPGHPELQNIYSLLRELTVELMQHLAKEEQILFPYIAQMENAQNGNGTLPHSCFGTVRNPIAMMTQEHDGAGALLAEMSRLSNHYTAPQDACPTFLAFYNGLRDFELDLHQHIHLENNILFPRAVEMEQKSLSYAHR